MSLHFDTLAVHGGYSPESANRAVAVPIYQTSSFAFKSSQHALDVFTLGATEDLAYTRTGNPTQAVLEERVAALEGGTAALALASGMAAVSYTIQALSRVGDNVIVTRGLYGSSHVYFDNLLPQSGVEARFIDPDDPDAVARVADDRTIAVFAETIGNPLGNVLDLEAFARAAHAVGAPLVIDNTVPSPALVRPFEFGADIVVHSLTKYLGGHGNSIGGAIVDGGSFPWLEHADRYPGLTRPEPAYQNAVFAEQFPDAALAIRARAVLLRSLGAAISPFNAFLILQGIETLPLRIEKVCSNALAVAQYLERHPAVEWVRYAGLPSHPDHALLQKYAGGKASGLLSFGIAGGYEAGARFIDALGLLTHLVNIGDAKSLACHPASTTHHQLSETQLQEAGLSSDLVRLVIGIEHIDDILADIEQALDVAVSGRDREPAVAGRE
ncbi:O-acetylhomoserine aminocarboxypropyltransferase/cysteine synthase family protein [Propionicicella superfundia]|uniref:O-acetylhomoserine aminocarboxypropyltransferase/cysteine synthase family protein n=1 Tax=Propionicicella superfundia TaxID=348582 RepID=UPI000401D198|nr:O-acetylhomoserine aminocarboxypropyltransferase/cysteine synthase family protein [Propionicicella superfundia]